MKRPASISLISLLVISTIALILVLGMSESNISTSYQYLDSRSDSQMAYMADACLDEALIRLEQDIGFVSSSITFDANNSCSITVSGSGPMTLSISVSSYDYTQSFEAQVSYSSSGEVNNFSLDSWGEV
jgi:hypothetical protein